MSVTATKICLCLLIKPELNRSPVYPWKQWKWCVFYSENIYSESKQIKEWPRRLGGSKITRSIPMKQLELTTCGNALQYSATLIVIWQSLNQQDVF